MCHVNECIKMKSVSALQIYVHEIYCECVHRSTQKDDDFDLVILACRNAEKRLRCIIDREIDECDGYCVGVCMYIRIYLTHHLIIYRTTDFSFFPLFRCVALFIFSLSSFIARVAPLGMAFCSFHPYMTFFHFLLLRFLKLLSYHI